ncbi:hypothetical protein QI122_03595 [Staphylococcus saprophyticus]|nr:hypothetical protein [Staphylococcus saprophyticus]MDW4332160.1 hypothetical protein [Staphylococcus saprophyticus]
MAINVWGNVDENLMKEKYDNVIDKFDTIYEIIDKLSESLIEKWFEDENGEFNVNYFYKSVEYQVANDERKLLEDFNFLCLDIATSYSKALVHFDVMENLNNDTEEYKFEMYWFQYYAQFAIRLIGTFEDYIYHYVNLFNGYQITNNARFKCEVSKKLKNDKKINVKNALETSKSNLNKYRNDITHNFNIFKNRKLIKKEVDKLEINEPSINSPEQFIKDFEEILNDVFDKFNKVFKLN